MKRLVLVRHGETIWHAENRYAGRSDIPLTQLGLRQAEALAAWAPTAGLHAVWSSPLSRARLTAEPVAAALGTLLQIEPGLVEIDFGEAEGRSPEEMQVRFPEARQAFLRNPVTHPLPGGEDPVSATRRAVAALFAIADSLPDDGRALITTHSTLIRLSLCHVLGLPLARYRQLFPKLANTTITELGFKGHDVALLAFNAPLTHQER